MNAVVDERTARIALNKVSEPMDTTVATLVHSHGAVAAWKQVSSGRGKKHDRFAARVADFDLDRTLHVADRLGIRILVPGEPEWPSGLDDLLLPPLCLWVRGPVNLGDAMTRSASVVGARLATSYGEAVAREICYDLAGRGFCIVSGGAYGIDAAAHRGALAGDGRTIAAMAGGVDRLYPAGNRDLLEEIVRTGAVLSESPPGSSPQRHRFLARNRLIAAMTPGTVVVEAGIRSGSLNTARNAEVLNRIVAAVPGPVTSTSSVGTNELIRVGIASLVTDAAECAELLGALGTDLASPVHSATALTDDLSEIPRRVLDALPVRRSSTVDQLTRSAGLCVGDVLGGLGALELRGLAARAADGWRRAG